MRNKKNILKIFLVILIIAGVYFAVKYTGAHDHHKRHWVNELKTFLNSYGRWSTAVFIIICALRPLVAVIPASFLAIAAGMIYGPFFGTIYTMIGVFLSATVGFYLARFLGQAFVERVLRGKSARIEGDIERHGFTIMLFLRLAFIFPFDPLSYAAGITKMKYRDFIIGTVIGVFPEMFAYNYLGTNIHNPFSKQTLLAVAIIIIFAVGSLLIKSRKKKK